MEAAAQGEPGLIILEEDVEIAHLYMITVKRRPIPRTRPWVVIRRPNVVVSNLNPVIVEKHPALDPHSVLAGFSDLFQKAALSGALKKLRNRARASPPT